MPVLLTLLLFPVQEPINDPPPMGGPFTVRMGGLDLRYSVEGETASGPVIPLHPFTSFVECFKGPGASGIILNDPRPVVQSGGLVFWVSTQTLENAADVAICSWHDADHDGDVDLRDFAAAQNQIPQWH